MAVKESEILVLLTQQNGIVVIPTGTPLTRLNYFDGKFLRASDLKTEQEYLRQLVWQSNQAGGSGVVHGFDLTLGGGDTLNLGAGLAINPDGRVLLLPQDVSISIQELIEKSRDLQKSFKEGHVISTNDFEECYVASETPPVNTTHPNDLYLIVICPAEALCGEEDVYGKLCEEACATSNDRPYAIEGLVVRAVPLVLRTPLPHSKVVSIATRKHLRSRVASAYFEDERLGVTSMISRFGLEQEVWCLGADAANGACLPIGVIARAGATTVFLDAWISRRERMDTPPRRYWQWRMMMRPWDVFLAQILQFQCQLRDVFGGGLTPGGEDPCGDARTVIGEAAKKIVDLIEAHREMTPKLETADIVGQMDAFKAKMQELEQMGQKLTATEQQMPVPMGDRLLIRGGIIELPSAGYLPVAPDANASVNQQVRQMMGEGVDLRFCIVRPDYVAHALEEAQHMERISLIEGLDDPKKKPQVDILVPNGKILEDKQLVSGGFEASVRILPDYVDDLMWAIGNAAMTPGVDQTIRSLDQLGLTLKFNGAARQETLTSGHTFYAALLLDDSFVATLMASFFMGPTLRAQDLNNSKVDLGTADQKSTSEDQVVEMSNTPIFSRLKAAASKRREQAAEPRSAIPTAEINASAFMAAPESAASTEPMLPAGLWLTANCAQDLRKIQKNETLLISGRAVIGSMIPVGAGISAYVDFRMNVEAFVVGAGTLSDGSGFFKCNASVFGAIITGLRDSKRSDSRVVNVEVEVRWARLAGDAGPASRSASSIPSRKSQLCLMARGPDLRLHSVEP